MLDTFYTYFSAVFIIVTNDSAFSDAPPISAPLTLMSLNIESAFSDVTLPPYKINVLLAVDPNLLFNISLNLL
jgi:hypothetical protein